MLSNDVIHVSEMSVGTYNTPFSPSRRKGLWPLASAFAHEIRRTVIVQRIFNCNKIIPITCHWPPAYALVRMKFLRLSVREAWVRSIRPVTRGSAATWR